MTIRTTITALITMIATGGVAAAAPAKPPTVTVAGTRAKASSGTGECFNVTVTNVSDQPLSAFNLAVYAYNKGKQQIGDKYEYENHSLGKDLAPGAKTDLCTQSTSHFKGDVASIDAVVYDATFADKTTWRKNIPSKKAKGAKAF